MTCPFQRQESAATTMQLIYATVPTPALQDCTFFWQDASCPKALYNRLRWSFWASIPSEKATWKYSKYGAQNSWQLPVLRTLHIKIMVFELNNQKTSWICMNHHDIITFIQIWLIRSNMHYLEGCTQLGKWKDLSPVGFWARCQLE